MFAQQPRDQQSRRVIATVAIAHANNKYGCVRVCAHCVLLPLMADG
jgi:hypothetical protein